MPDPYLQGSDDVARGGRNMLEAAERIERAVADFGHYTERVMSACSEAAVAMTALTEVLNKNGLAEALQDDLADDEVHRA